MLPQVKQEVAEWFHQRGNDAARRLTETLHVGSSPIGTTLQNVRRAEAATQASE